MAWWQFLLAQAAVGGGIWAFLRFSLGEIARGAVDQAVGEALNRQQHEFDRQLQVLGLERDRLAEEHGLLAQKRLETYSAIYQKFAEAASRAGARAGITIAPDFDNWSEERIGMFLKDEAKLTDQEVGEAVVKWKAGGKNRSDHLHRINQTLRLNEADRALNQAAILAEEGALFLSDDVEACLTKLGNSAGALLTRIRFPDDGAREMSKLLEMREAMRKDMAELKATIRNEIRRGSGPLPLDKAGQSDGQAVVTDSNGERSLPPANQPKAIASSR